MDDDMSEDEILEARIDQAYSERHNAIQAKDDFLISWYDKVIRDLENGEEDLEDGEEDDCSVFAQQLRSAAQRNSH